MLKWYGKGCYTKRERKGFWFRKLFNMHAWWWSKEIELESTFQSLGWKCFNPITDFSCTQGVFNVLGLMGERLKDVLKLKREIFSSSDHYNYKILWPQVFILRLSMILQYLEEQYGTFWEITSVLICLAYVQKASAIIHNILSLYCEFNSVCQNLRNFIKPREPKYNFDKLALFVFVQFDLKSFTEKLAAFQVNNNP